jgi:hypothetical protein
VTAGWILLLASIPAIAASPAAAQAIKPWVPPAADSLLRWSAEAKARFQTNTGDSINGSNYRAYELVGTMGRRLLRSLGREHLVQAHAIKPVLDSLGLETDVAVDPELPYFVLLMVRNPYHRSADAVGFMYWYKERDLRMQGALFRGGMNPQMRVWWTGKQDGPYEWGVVDRPRTQGPMHLALFRLASSGKFWNLVQYDDLSPELGPTGSVSWADVDGDGKPELVSWTKDVADSLFESCPDCPNLISELLFIERAEGFGLHDIRLVPSPYATLVQFVRLLLDNHREQASRLLKDPSWMRQAVAAGWGLRRTARTWKIETVEADTQWPRWLEVRFRGPMGDRRYVIHFEQFRGRWIIRDWESRDLARPTTPRSAPGAR